MRVSIAYEGGGSATSTGSGDVVGASLVEERMGCARWKNDDGDHVWEAFSFTPRGRLCRVRCAIPVTRKP